MKLYVLMDNDFPIGIYETQKLADLAKKSFLRRSGNPDSHRIRSYEFELDAPAHF